MMLRFDFLGKTQLFRCPLTVIETNNLADIEACMADIELANRQGYYVAGYVAYEAAPAFNQDAMVSEANSMPLLWFGVYQAPQTISKCNELGIKSNTIWQANVEEQQYRKIIKTIKDQIRRGNLYQTNYTIRLSGRVDVDSYQLYLHLLDMQRSNYSAYLDIGEYAILSVSPELFFHYNKNGRIITKPMKGTAARGNTLSRDNEQCNRLVNDKNRSENMMIVDLLRNDLNQVAETGSVTVDQLFSAEKYPTVWQLTSTISANVSNNKTLFDLFKALFPSGSITGAPKSSAMRWIAQLEKEPRGVYCGAIGMVMPDREAIFNVAIRTLTINKKTSLGQYGVGGGITWDSTAEDEYKEIIDKARVLKESPLPRYLLETILLDEGHYFLLERHLERLSRCAYYFSFNYPQAVIEQRLRLLADEKPRGQFKIRLRLYPSSQITVEVMDLLPSIAPLYASLSPLAVNSTNRFLYYKTDKRDFYPTVSNGHEYLLFNEQGHLTEFVNGNVALLIAGQWLTPPITSGLLAGTFRDQLISEGKLKEVMLTVARLKKAEKIAFINSIRKWRDVVWRPTSAMPC